MPKAGKWPTANPMTEQAYRPRIRVKATFPSFVSHSVTLKRWRHPSTIPSTVIREALHALFPTSLDRLGVSDTPLHGGLNEQLARLLNGRATLSALRRWRLGNRGAPNWFVATLRDRLVQRRAEIDAAISGLDALPERKGLGYGLKRWQKQKREREIEAQNNRERKETREKLIRGG